MHRFTREETLRGAQSSLRHGAVRLTADPNLRKLYDRWAGMRERCSPKSTNPQYRNGYVERGIHVCERWKDFKNFVADVGFPPTWSYTLDRIDNDGNYEPGNVRWATPTQQARNRRKKPLVDRTIRWKVSGHTDCPVCGVSRIAVIGNNRRIIRHLPGLRNRKQTGFGLCAGSGQSIAGGFVLAKVIR